MSNVYPEWWCDTVTLYNKYEASNGEVTWYKTTLAGCFWKYTGNTVNVGQTILETKDIICRVPEQDNFLERYQWEQLPNDQLAYYFTISPEDIIVKGEVEDEIDEYVKFYNNVIKVGFSNNDALEYLNFYSESEKKLARVR